MRLIRKNVERVAVTETQIEKLKAQGFQPIDGAPQEAAPMSLGMNSKTVAELKQLAKEKGIEGYSALTKEELLAVLKGVV